MRWFNVLSLVAGTFILLDCDHQPLGPAKPRVPVLATTNYGTLNIVTLDGSNTLTVVNNQQGYMYFMSWSPDGSQIVYQLLDAGVLSHVYTVTTNGSTIKRLVADAPAASSPHWSPNGKKIALVAGEWSGNRDVWVVNTAYGNPIQYSKSIRIPHLPRWSPDGRMIAVIDWSGGGLVVIDEFKNELKIVPDSIHVRDTFSWSPDSRQIAFCGYTSTTSYPGTSKLFFIVNADGSDLRALGPDSSLYGMAAWSPSGDRIAVITHKSQTFGPRVMELYYPAMDEFETIIGDTLSPNNPNWSPDGQFLAFDDIGGGVYVVNRNGSNLRSIAAGSQPVWAPKNVWPFEQ